MAGLLEARHVFVFAGTAVVAAGHLKRLQAALKPVELLRLLEASF